jgi:hypothetical protein
VPRRNFNLGKSQQVVGILEKCGGHFTQIKENNVKASKTNPVRNFLKGFIKKVIN